MRNWSLYDDLGYRKYLTAGERQAFFDAILEAQGRGKRTFALMLYYSGAWISEVLQLTCGRIDYERQRVVFRTQKQGKKAYLFVPMPSRFMKKLDDVHHVMFNHLFNRNIKLSQYVAWSPNLASWMKTSI